MATTAETQAPVTDLRACLLDWQARFNEHERVRKLVKKWNRYIVIETTDTNEVYTMTVQDRELTSVRDGWPPETDDYTVHGQASHATMVEIFSGNYHPTTALLDGMLAGNSSVEEGLS